MSAPATNVTQTPASQLVVGFLDDALTAVLREEEGVESTGEIEYIKSEAGDDAIALVSNKGKRISVSGYLKSGQSCPAIGDLITIGSAKYIVENASARYTAKAARATLTIYKPDNTTWAS